MKQNVDIKSNLRTIDLRFTQKMTNYVSVSQNCRFIYEFNTTDFDILNQKIITLFKIMIRRWYHGYQIS